ncbi:MAG: phosphodiester glycosidase family protein [Armatimonadetes bacterium]|nr:phosphodiester glycosidase family protein [Armatimonadota bacterium]
MSLIVAVLSLSQGAPRLPLQIWEKRIAPGLVYRAEIDPNVPRMIHVLRWMPGGPVRAVAELGGGTIYEPGATKGRETPSGMAERKGAIATLNGDFFPYAGDPLGFMMRDGELLSVPFVRKSNPYVVRSAMGWNDRGAFWPVEPIRWSGTVESAGRTSVAIDGWACEAGENAVHVNPPFTGQAWSKPTECLHIIVSQTDGKWTPNGTVSGKVKEIKTDIQQLPIEPREFVVTVTGTKRAAWASTKVGDTIRVKSTFSGFGNVDLTQAIGGGPTVVRGGKSIVERVAEDEGFGGAFRTTPHPRTAIGRRANGEVWFMVVDGRQTMSTGFSLDDMANWFLNNGCVDAINLDGGGSSELFVNGVIANRPSDGTERPNANGVMFLGPKPANAENYKILGTEMVRLGSPANLKVRVDGGDPVPNSEVIWSCQGAGWIDQGGRLTVLKEGKINLSASVRGKVISQAISIVP